MGALVDSAGALVDSVGALWLILWGALAGQSEVVVVKFEIAQKIIACYSQEESPGNTEQGSR